MSKRIGNTMIASIGVSPQEAIQDAENESYRKKWLTLCIGETEVEVRKSCEEGGGILRVTERDGCRYVGTRDVKMNRVNVKIKDGVVFSAHYG